MLQTNPYWGIAMREAHALKRERMSRYCQLLAVLLGINIFGIELEKEEKRFNR